MDKHLMRMLIRVGGRLTFMVLMQTVNGVVEAHITIIRGAGDLNAMMTDKKTRNNARVWIASAHVKPSGLVHVLGSHRRGAYVNAAVLAVSIQEIELLINRELECDGLHVVEITEVGEEENYRSEDRINAEIDSLIIRLSESVPVLFGSFHTYGHDDA